MEASAALRLPDHHPDLGGHHAAILAVTMSGRRTRRTGDSERTRCGHVPRGQGNPDVALFGVGQNASIGSAAKRPHFTEYLSDDDETMLGDLYRSAEANGADLEEVDKLAEALGALRRSEAALKGSGVLSLLAPLDAAPPPHQKALDRGKLQDRL